MELRFLFFVGFEKSLCAGPVGSCLRAAFLLNIHVLFFCRALLAAKILKNLDGPICITNISCTFVSSVSLRVDELMARHIGMSLNTRTIVQQSCKASMRDKQCAYTHC